MVVVFSKVEEEKEKKIIEFLLKSLKHTPEKRTFSLREICYAVDETPNTCKRILDKIEKHQMLNLKPIVVKQYVKLI